MVRWFQNTYAGRRVLRGYEREDGRLGSRARVWRRSRHQLTTMSRMYVNENQVAHEAFG